MSRTILAVSSVLFATLCTVHAAPITFGPIRAQAGQSVRLVSHSDSLKGTITRTGAGGSESGTVQITRDRDLVWTFRDPAADGTRRGMVKVNSLSTSGKIDVGGKIEKIADSSPLDGKMFSMSKSPDGEWKFELDGSVPMMRVEREIKELTVYLKRDWYPAREIKAGDSWEFDPSWIRMIIERDFSSAKTIGTMRLAQVRHTAEKTIAVIDVTVESTGAGFHADGSSEDGSVNLRGQVMVNLNTMLDEHLELKGTVVTETARDGITTKMKMPVNLLITKTFVRGF